MPLKRPSRHRLQFEREASQPIYHSIVPCPLFFLLIENMWFYEWSNPLFAFPTVHFGGAPPPPTTTIPAAAPIHPPNALWEEVRVILSTYDPDLATHTDGTFEAEIARCYQALSANKLLFPDPPSPTGSGGGGPMAAAGTTTFYIH